VSKWRPRPEIWRRRGVFWLAILLLGGLGYALAGNVQDRLREAEATSVRVTLNNLRSQLVIEQATARTQLRRSELMEYEGRNPFELVEETPSNYEGNCPDDATDQSRGSWCYEAETGVVFYRPRFDGVASAEKMQTGRHGWHLELNRDQPGQPELQLTPLTRNEN